MNSVAMIRSYLQFPEFGKFHQLKVPLTSVEVSGLFARAVAEQDKLNPIPTPIGVVLGPVANPSNIEYREIRRVLPTLTVTGASVGVAF